MKIAWLTKAQYDLNSIDNYYSEVASKTVSAKILKRIVTSAKLLKENPYMGSASDDEDILEWYVPKTSYTLPYRVINNEIQILRVFHQSQDKPSSWEEN